MRVIPPAAPPGRLERQDESYTPLDLAHGVQVETAGTSGEHGAVECDDLRDVGHGLLGEPGGSRGEKDVAGRVDEAEVRGEDDGHDGADSATVEGVALYDQYGPPVAGR